LLRRLLLGYRRQLEWERAVQENIGSWAAAHFGCQLLGEGELENIWIHWQLV
jgi:hypothetical protein